MIQSNNNLSPLPFYGSIEEQNHRRSYAYGNVYPLFAQNNLLLPFQIMRTRRNNSITSAYVYDINGNQIRNILSDLQTAGLAIVKDSNVNYDVVVFPANLPFPEDLPIGQCYLKLSDGVDTWFSDVLTLVNSLDGYLKIEWWDDENAYYDCGEIVYKDELVNYVNKLYLCTELGKPDYVFEEEGESRDGYFFAEKQISYKTYRFQFLAPEYLCDAMRIIRLSDHVRITDIYGREYECDTFSIEPTWQEQGDLASVEAEFTTATVVKKTGRGYVDIIGANGDFNDDYNNDFDTSRDA